MTKEIATSTMTNTPLDAAFINPSFGYPIIKKKGLFYTKMWPPLSLAYCAAIMEERGLKVAIVDAQAERLGPEQAAERASAAGPIPSISNPSKAGIVFSRIRSRPLPGRETDTGRESIGPPIF